MSTLTRILPAALLVAAFLAGCASMNDGGIVGSGNRIDCEAARKDGGRTLPPECQQPH